MDCVGNVGNIIIKRRIIEMESQLPLDSVIFIASWSKRNLQANEQRPFFDYLLTLDALYVENTELGKLYGNYLIQKGENK